MQHRPLGSSGLQVSRLGLGTMAWGRDVEWPQARDLLRDFVDAGGTLVDTAPAYGAGVAEKMVGKALAGGLPREALVIATKAGFVIRDGRRVIDTSRGALLSDLEQSLRRLGTDHVDLWQVHAWGDAPLEETLSALDYAVTTGRASYVGVSNYTGWQSAKAATRQAAVAGRARLASNQVEYSLMNRSAEAEVIPAAQDLGLGVLPWSPLGRGVLTGKYRTGTPADSRAASPHFANFVGAYLTDLHARIVEAVARAADGLSWTPMEVALSWVRDRPGVTAPIVGARTAAQLRGALTVEECELPAEIIAALEDVSAPTT